jgi:hypothetical protein
MTKLNWQRCKKQLPALSEEYPKAKSKSILLGDRITIGKYTGNKLTGIPKHYLIWLLKEKVAKTSNDVKKIKEVISLVS